MALLQRTMESNDLLAWLVPVNKHFDRLFDNSSVTQMSVAESVMFHSADRVRRWLPCSSGIQAMAGTAYSASRDDHFQHTAMEMHP